MPADGSEPVAAVRRWPIATDFQRPVQCLLGLPFDAIALDGAVSRIRHAAETGTRCFFSTPNLNFAVGAMRDAAFRDSVLKSDLSLADGMPLVWIARLFGLPIVERVSGADVFEALRRPHAPPTPVFFFGGQEGAAEAAAAALRPATGPAGVVAVGHRSPGFGSIEGMSDPATLDAINRSRARFVVVSLGARKGQAWIEHNLDRLDAPVISHLGAVVNFVTGTVRRAPPLVQRLGLEWLWRIREEPMLWRRYAGDGWALAGLFATRVVPAAWDARQNAPGPDALARARLETSIDADRSTLVLHGAWAAGNLQPLRDAMATIVARPGAVVVDLGSTTFVDSAAIGLLLLLYGHQAKGGHRLEVRGADRTMRRRLFRYGAAFLFGARPGSVTSATAG